MSASVGKRKTFKWITTWCSNRKKK